MAGKRLALHWKILIGLVLGLVVGLVVNAAWTPRTWESLGVDHPKAYVARKAAEVPVLPAGIARVADLDPADASLAGLYPYQLSKAQIARFNLETRPANQSPSFGARAARFVRTLNTFVGDLFIRLLRFIAVPIVLFSLIVGVSSLHDLKKLGRIGAKTLIIYLCTTAPAITIGLTVANVVQPGSARFVPAETRERLAVAGGEEAAAKVAEAAAAPSAWQVLLNIVPVNPFEALAKGEMLQVVFFALMIGIGLTFIPRDKAGPVIAAFDALTDVIIRIVHWIMLVAPYAVFALIARVLADLGLDVLRALLAYSGVVIAGLVLMAFVIYPSILLTLARGRMGYRRFFRGIAPAQLLAFSSSSSSATLPVTMDCARNRLGISEDVTSFVLPLGATINMDGTALYQGVATVFIAQMFGIPLDLGAQLMIVLTATLASIGTAGVPGVGIVMLVIVLQAVRMPPEVMTTGIAIILGVDRILDMCRTTVNVTGDCMVATLVAATENELASAEEVEGRRAADAAEADE